jgi:uncharacterized membrane protein
MELFFWISSIVIVVLQYFNHKYLGQGNLKRAYPLAVVIYTMYAIVETALALTNPNQMGIMVFNLVNGWALYNAVIGIRRLKREEREKEHMTWATPYIEQLKEPGDTVSFRPKGNSMVPLIRSGNLVTVRKFVEADFRTLKKGDIVLCKVNGKQYLHKVYSVEYSVSGPMVLIGNNKGRTNGWTSKIYGIVTGVEA